MSIKLTQYVFPPFLVDKRRKFVGQYGITLAGPLDELHFAYNHILLGNSSDESALECIGQIQFYVTEETILAFTGACEVFVDGYKYPSATGKFAKGSIITVCPTADGFRFYIGCYSGFAGAEILSSCNVVPREGFGTLLQLDTVIPAKQTLQGQTYTALTQTKAKPHFLAALLFCTDSISQLYRNERFTLLDSADKQFSSSAQGITLIPFIKSVAHDSFSITQRMHFQTSVFTILPDSNRMGYRLEEHTQLRHNIKLENSQVTLLGGLQITPAGQTIVLMNDKQTVGGYPMMGYVTSLGRSRLAQLAMDKPIKFVEQNVHSAHAEQMLLLAWLERYCANSELPC